MEILRSDGFDALGVNAIAERAGVSKVLIYRYFGGLSGLLTELGREIDPIDSGLAGRALEASGDEAEPAEVVRQAVLALRESVAQNDLTRALLRWELSEQNQATKSIAASREQLGLRQTAALESYLAERGLDSQIDAHALLALVTGGVYYLSLRAESVRHFNGIDIRSKEGWARIANVLTPFVRALVRSSAPARKPATQESPAAIRRRSRRK